MFLRSNKIFKERYPQNFLIKRPIIGTLIFLVCIFVFIIIYQPLHVRNARSFSFHFTILLYCLIFSATIFILTLILKKLHFFSDCETWTFSKELLFDVIILFGISISVYFAGFVIEEPSSRWNFQTFLDSFQRALFLGVIPIFLFTLINIRYLFSPPIFQNYTSSSGGNQEGAELLVNITSKAKKEELSFYTDQFIYAESHGNYIVFHLFIKDKPREVIIRNSISNIEQQFTKIPWFMRVHRAYIVNLKKVKFKSGNTLGYRLKLADKSDTIPVSRQNISKFDQLIELYQ
mgnify:CR=1 FL=1